MPDSDGLQENDSFHIRCTDAVELVTDYLDDALNMGDLAAFEAHLADCEGCTIFVDQIRMTIRLTSATGDRNVKVMPANFDNLLSQLRDRSSDGTAR